MLDGTGTERASMILTTVKIAATVAGLSWLAAHWMSSVSDRQGLAQLAAQITGRHDPVTTGSIGARAAATRIDPCVVRRP